MRMYRNDICISYVQDLCNAISVEDMAGFTGGEGGGVELSTNFRPSYKLCTKTRKFRYPSPPLKR